MRRWFLSTHLHILTEPIPASCVLDIIGETFAFKSHLDTRVDGLVNGLEASHVRLFTFHRASINGTMAREKASPYS